jgi:4-hydroxy-3-polyprenylbenzoate decarboxylase
MAARRERGAKAPARDAAARPAKSAQTSGARRSPMRGGKRGPTARRSARRGGRRYLIAMTGASGAIHGADFVRRCPGEKYLVLSDWARQVLFGETGLKPADLEPHVRKIFADADLAAPFSSGSNRHDAMIVIPCSVSTLAKIAAGIADSLITRAAAVALKERMRLVLCLRETPLSSIALENALKLSREGVVIMPIAPPWYRNPKTIEESVAGFTDKVLALLGE